MKLKIALIGATALGMLIATGVAYAGGGNTAVIDQANDSNSASIDQSDGSSNTSKFVQNGNDNSADVTQSGDRNIAGAHVFSNAWADPYEAARGYRYIIQQGSDNSLSILQTLNGNQVGDGNVSQLGNHNDIDISQQGGTNDIYFGVGGTVDSVTQTGSSTATHLTNKLTVKQEGATDGAYAAVPAGSSDYHYAPEHIGTVTQTNIGVGNSNGLANTLALTQKGGIHNAGNSIITVTQDGTSNEGTVTQTGRSNYLALLSQTGAGNTASITLTGDLNGSAGGAFALPDALAVGIGQSIVTQDGGDTASYSATGSSNLYGIVQVTGSGNIVTGTVTGSSNNAAVKQNGAGNISDFIQNGSSNDLGVLITGNNNGVGPFRAHSLVTGVTNGDVDQEGNGNAVSFAITGNDANYGVHQTNGGNVVIASLTGPGSHDNNLAISQTGSDYAKVTMTGSQNVMGVSQTSTGTGTNSLTATITGNLNNWSGNFSGMAETALLTPGQVTQNNTGSLGQNLINLTVTADSDLFAFDQQGSNDSITGTINGSTGGNQVAVVQTGNSNTAAFTQNGNGNNAVIQQ